MKLLSPTIIEKKILENYMEYQNLFVQFQSKFLTELHTKYQGLENGNIFLYYAKQTHQDILRQKDYDLNFNLSYKNFWSNHHRANPRKKSIVNIAEDTFLPKETARRKILELIKQQVLGKKNKKISWLPNEQYKQSYNLYVNQEIKDVSRLISFVSEKINFSISSEVIIEEIEEKFSFYWFHYLNVQLNYLKLWTKQFNDRELILIFLQLASMFVSKAKEKNLSYKDLYDKPSLIQNFISSSISVTSISEVTSIPRATCVRKLSRLVALKVIEQDKNTKRYYIIPNSIADNLISKKITGEIIKLFSEFYFICIRAINAKV